MPTGKNNPDPCQSGSARIRGASQTPGKEERTPISQLYVFNSDTWGSVLIRILKGIVSRKYDIPVRYFYLLSLDSLEVSTLSLCTRFYTVAIFDFMSNFRIFKVPGSFFC
jgi:hypothetical protein